MTDSVESHILKKYQLLKKVGSGAYGHVWKVTDKKTGQILALKKIFDAFQHSTDAQRTYREIMFLSEFKHENIIKLHNVFKADNDKDLYLVFEFMEADLHNAIGQKILKDVHNRFIFYQIIKGMKYLHSASVIHRDLKPSNILINSDCHIKICDFGLARSLVSDEPDKDVVLTEEVATRWYRAPQVLLGSKNYGTAADVWSIGCILMEILIGKPFFPGNSTLNQLERILAFTGNPTQKDIDSLEADCAQTMIKSVNMTRARAIKEWFKSDTPLQAIDLVVKMLQFNPEKRINIDEILKHPYLAQFRDARTQIESRKAIRPPVSDNKKLNLKQYRNLIYESINKIFNPPEERIFSIERKTTSNSISRENRKESGSKKPLEYHSNSYHFSSSQTKSYYNSVQRSGTKTPTMASSSAKKIGHSMSHNNFFPARASLGDEDRIKQKSSLKDLLRQRKSAAKSEKEKISCSMNTSIYNPYSSSSSPYQPLQQSTGNLLQYKYYKNASYNGQKQNKSLYNRA